MRISNDLALDGAEMTDTETIESAAIWIGHAAGAAIQAVWTGTPEGTLKLQCSVDPTQPQPGITPSLTNWEDIADSEYAVAGAAGSYTWNVDAAYFPWVRAVYTNASGTGSLNVRFNSKGF